MLVSFLMLLWVLRQLKWDLSHVRTLDRQFVTKFCIYLYVTNCFKNLNFLNSREETFLILAGKYPLGSVQLVSGQHWAIHLF